MKTPRPTRAQRSQERREAHHQRRMETIQATDHEAAAKVWAEQLRCEARRRAKADDLTGWAGLAEALEEFCGQVPSADPGNRRAAVKAHHWELRRAGLVDADPQTLATAWWDRARSLARDHGETEWSRLSLALQNLAARLQTVTGEPSPSSSSSP